MEVINNPTEDPSQSLGRHARQMVQSRARREAFGRQDDVRPAPSDGVDEIGESGPIRRARIRVREARYSWEDSPAVPTLERGP